MWMVSSAQKPLSRLCKAFVVAADRNWLSACFEAGYETFNGKIAQVEQPTGYRFFENANGDSWKE